MSTSRFYKWLLRAENFSELSRHDACFVLDRFVVQKMRWRRLTRVDSEKSEIMGL